MSGIKRLSYTPGAARKTWGALLVGLLIGNYHAFHHLVFARLQLERVHAR